MLFSFFVQKIKNQAIKIETMAMTHSTKNTPSNHLSATRSLCSQTAPISTDASFDPSTNCKPKKTSLTKALVRNLTDKCSSGHCNDEDRANNNVANKDS